MRKRFLYCITLTMSGEYMPPFLYNFDKVYSQVTISKCNANAIDMGSRVYVEVAWPIGHTCDERD